MRKIIFVVSILVCCPLGLVMAQEKTTLATEKKATGLENAPIETFPKEAQPAVKVYIDCATAAAEGAYRKAWDLCCSSYLQGAWSSFEEYKQANLKNPKSAYEFRRIVKEATVVSPTEVHVKAGSGQTFVMSYENGRWCKKGNLADLSVGNFDGEER